MLYEVYVAVRNAPKLPRCKGPVIGITYIVEAGSQKVATDKAYARAKLTQGAQPRKYRGATFVVAKIKSIPSIKEHYAENYNPLADVHYRL